MSTHRIIIGLHGPARTGKDTAADHLVEKYGFVKVALADEMKRTAQRWFGFSYEQLWGPSEKREVPDMRYPVPTAGFLTPRKVLQLMGTEIGRLIYQDTWVRYTLEVCEQVLEGTHTYSDWGGARERKSSFWMRYFAKKPQGVVIPDVRFANEIAAIQKWGGVVVRLKRKGPEGAQGGVRGHASETEQKTIPDDALDYVLEVPEGIPAYCKALDKLYARMPKVRGARLRLAA